MGVILLQRNIMYAILAINTPQNKFLSRRYHGKLRERPDNELPATLNVILRPQQFIETCSGDKRHARRKYIAPHSSIGIGLDPVNMVVMENVKRSRKYKYVRRVVRASIYFHFREQQGACVYAAVDYFPMKIVPVVR